MWDVNGKFTLTYMLCYVIIGWLYYGGQYYRCSYHKEQYINENNLIINLFKNLLLYYFIVSSCMDTSHIQQL